MDDSKDKTLETIKEKLEKAFGGIPIQVTEVPFFDGNNVQKGNNFMNQDNNANEEEFIKKIEEFNLKPKDIRDYLNRYVVKQDEAKKVLSVAICDHYNHVKQCLKNPEKADHLYLKQNVLVLGPT